MLSAGELLQTLTLVLTLTESLVSMIATSLNPNNRGGQLLIALFDARTFTNSVT